MPQFAEATPTDVRAVRWDGRRATEAREELAGEEPLEIRVRGRAISVTMRTPPPPTENPPTSDMELAAGFLLTEGVIGSAADIEAMEPCTANEMGNVMNVRLAPLVHVDFERLTRHVFAGSSCGVCGKATIEAVRAAGACRVVQSGARVSAAALGAMPATMRGAQEVFDRTGGLHAAGLFGIGGEVLVVREDVGRHNAVDKVIGWAVLSGRIPLAESVLMVSGRASFEIMQKACAAGIGIVAAVSAPSSLAVAFAEEMGQTLVGFVREGRMNVYTHPRRIVFP